MKLATDEHGFTRMDLESAASPNIRVPSVLICGPFFFSR
jgi:hypothetical protein